MYVSARERKLLERLLADDRDVTVGELAEELNVSARTVHRDLQGLESVLRRYGLGLAKKAGVGIRLVGAEENKQALAAELLRLSHHEYTPEERQLMILIALLEATEPVKLVSLAHDLNVTVATVSLDLDKLEQTVEAYGLSLIRKRGYGVELAGSESAKRRLISDLLFRHVDEHEFLALMKETIQKRADDPFDTMAEKLLGLVDRKKLTVIEKQIEQVKEKLPFTMADSSYIAFVVHLALAIERIKRGEAIHFDQQDLQAIQATKEYEIAGVLAESLERAFGVDIPKEEIGYMTMHLMGAKWRSRQGAVMEEPSLVVGMKAQQLIRFVSRELGVDLSVDCTLYEDLVVHLKPALYRLEHGMGIANPLLDQIKQDYAELFVIVADGARQLFGDIPVPDEEIGYLVLHFAAALMREKKGWKVLVICSSGLGTAKMLATRLKKEIPDIVSLEQASVFEWKGKDVSGYDLVISTVPLPEEYGPHIVVSPMLTEEEARKIRECLERKSAAEKRMEKEPMARRNRPALDTMKAVRRISETIIHILDGFSLEVVKVRSIHELLADACRRLERNGVIVDADVVLEELRRRESLGGLGVPGTRLALYHARSFAVLRPSLTMYRLDAPQTAAGMDGKPMDINTVVLLLGPADVDEEMLAVLSHISSLFVKDEQTLAILTHGDEEQVHLLISAHLEQFFDDYWTLAKE
ncbi:PTS system, Lactose/Cellobiose specific IIB subunit [Geobacillus kaustophilus]|uniref:PTS system, Lactose/Cellobiose specific IIB subunit n=1 Tax=Geobacillus kaustophilus TaxID=1462 RepID=A0A0D8BY31_GEOKU|nr:PRD domain-containing protein [Geobacillus kaustophilus]KJE29040.1 PTS system, Lactose/Cellobiose specific IIB subunit [Geobacillus kaustophilus]